MVKDSKKTKSDTIPEAHCSPSKPGAQFPGQVPSVFAHISEPAQLPHELAQFSPYSPSSHPGIYRENTR